MSRDRRFREEQPVGEPGSSPSTELTRRRYDRIARFYDGLEWIMERRVRRWREDLWSRVPAGRVLEVGVGTGKNLVYHPSESDVVALDLSAEMMARARRKADRLEARVALELGDVQRLPHAEATFDTVVASFVFCSVPDPLLGLAEVRRVLKPGGRLLLLEHVLSDNKVLRRLMRSLDPIPFWVWGAHIDRVTVTNVREAGFRNIVDTDLSLDIVKLIEARAPSPAQPDATPLPPPIG